MLFSLNRSWTPWLFALAAVVALAGYTIAADDKAPEWLSAPEQKQEAPAPDPFVVPDGTPEELLEYVGQLRKTKFKVKSQEAAKEVVRKSLLATIEAVDKIFADKPTDEQAAKATNFKLSALSILRRINDPTVEGKLKELHEQLVEGGWPKLARRVQAAILQSELWKALRGGDAAMVEKVFGKIKSHVSEAPPEVSDVQLANMTAQLLGMIGKHKLAGEAYQSFGELFEKSPDERIAKVGAKMKKSARLYLLIGNKMRIEGTTLEGKPFDPASYEGKVVLVMFWSTTCGPCRPETENVKKEYKLYHDRGFDVIGISCDSDREGLEKFLEEHEVPWTTLFEDDADKTGFKNPTADYYGISGIPTVVLIGRDGNVVALSPRGPKLRRELEKLIGPAEEKKG
jgi:peroxiredoxin